MRTYTEEELRSKNIEKVGSNFKQEVSYDGMVDAIKKVYRNEGVLGFYKGLTPMVLKIFPQSGLFFLVYEAALRLMRD